MKGNVEDLVIIVAFMLMFGMSVMIAYTVIDAWYDTDVVQGSTLLSENVESGMGSLQILGNSLIFITIMFGLASAIAAFFTETHPIFFVFSILVFSICMMVTVIFSDIFLQLAASSQLLPVANEFTLMIVTIQNYPIIGVLIGAVILLALYAKRDNISGAGGGMA